MTDTQQNVLGIALMVMIWGSAYVLVDHYDPEFMDGFIRWIGG